MSHTIVEIKKPCQITSEHMTPHKKGSFCRACQTAVVDFTNKTPEEISAYFMKHKDEAVCGTFNRMDVKTDSKTDKLISFFYSRKLKFAAIFILGILVLAGCRTRRGRPITRGKLSIAGETTQFFENLK
ncbi:MAG: hypothetical protein V4506_02835 [Bacteroidota bacterium]